MINIPHNPRLDALSPIPFPVELARSIETSGQRQRVLRQEWDRSLNALATRLGCLGWFGPTHDGPRAA
ncbi:MAG: hypothetical protein HOO04_06415 [Phycisphaerae bacterium]|nr:hypothetical protein [Phycisphaerae bacterium]MBT5382542.1 hypothetical protein [Phycisphaerae bacterium]MBT5584373.1 hypothetical protein [Phycisphaerae bacterium]MBT5658348.1 hypothetical protein [Phycisphaerae bacterium]MBT7351616.1 hypothetical protein [Phycisphaerae bacterium]